MRTIIGKQFPDHHYDHHDDYDDDGNDDDNFEYGHGEKKDFFYLALRGRYLGSSW